MENENPAQVWGAFLGEVIAQIAIRRFDIQEADLRSHFKSKDGLMLFFMLLKGYDDYPDIIEEVRPKNYEKLLFNELLKIEAEAMRENFTSPPQDDPYGIRKKFGLMFPTSRELKMFVDSKESSPKKRENPDYPSCKELMMDRIAHAAMQLQALSVEIAKKEISETQLVVARDQVGLPRYFYQGSPFTGTTVDRNGDVDVVDELGRKPVLMTIDFHDGYKHGKETEFAFTPSSYVQSYQPKPLSITYWAYNVKHYQAGVLVSDKYYGQDGREREKPLTRKLFGEAFKGKTWQTLRLSVTKNM